MAQLNDTPKYSDLIYDIGMHKGEDTDFYLQKGFRVIAFEADPDFVQGCRIRFKQYIDQKQLTIVEGAILDPNSKQAGQKRVLFYKNDTVSAWGTVCDDWTERNARRNTVSSTIEVDVVDFGSILVQYGIPHYMKIDIEGCDMTCVKTLKQFRERPDYISIESDKTSIAQNQSEIDALVELGYDSFQAVEQSAIPWVQFPPQPAREGKFVEHHFEAGSSGLFGSELKGQWKSRTEILRHYRVIQFGFRLIGYDGIVARWKFPGAWRLRSIIYRFVQLFTKKNIPGWWYDTHARHATVTAGKP